MKQKKKDSNYESRDIFISHIIKNEHAGYTGCADAFKDRISSKN